MKRAEHYSASERPQSMRNECLETIIPTVIVDELMQQSNFENPGIVNADAVSEPRIDDIAFLNSNLNEINEAVSRAKNFDSSQTR